MHSLEADVIAMPVEALSGAGSRELSSHGLSSYTSAEEYLRAERLALDKHEFVNGEIRTMPGASRYHNIIAYNLMRLLIAQNLSQFFVFQSDMRVYSPLTNRYVYPDLVVVEQEQMHFLDDKQDTLLNPIVLVEILSPSTQDYDRLEKFEGYKSIASLQEYVMIAQAEPHVEVFTRRQAHQWLYTEWKGSDCLGGTLHLEALGVDIALGEVYAKVQFDSV
jgi:Uma2 family endonuclease